MGKTLLGTSISRTSVSELETSQALLHRDAGVGDQVMAPVHPSTPVGNPEKVPGSWLQSLPSLCCCGQLGSEPIGTSSLFLSLMSNYILATLHPSI